LKSIGFCSELSLDIHDDKFNKSTLFVGELKECMQSTSDFLSLIDKVESFNFERKRGIFLITIRPIDK